MLLIASQISFQQIKKASGGVIVDQDGTIIGLKSAEGDSPVRADDDVVASQPTVTENLIEPAPTVQLNKNTTPIVPTAESKIVRTKVFPKPAQEGYVQNEEQSESNLWKKVTGKD